MCIISHSYLFCCGLRHRRKGCRVNSGAKGNPVTSAAGSVCSRFMAGCKQLKPHKGLRTSLTPIENDCAFRSDLPGSGRGSLSTDTF